MRSRSPRSDRTYTPATNFDRPPLREPITNLLAGIPETDWDTPLEALLWETPREAARHASIHGCAACRENLREITQA